MSNVEHVWQNELAAAEKQNENMAVDAVPSSWTMVVPTPTTAGENVAPRPLKVAGPITTAPLPPAGQQPATTAPTPQTDGKVKAAGSVGADLPPPLIVPGKPLPTVTIPASVDKGKVSAAMNESEQADADTAGAYSDMLSAQDEQQTAALSAQGNLQAEQERHEAAMLQLKQDGDLAIAAAEDKLAKSNVDPTRYISNMSTGRKIMSILALLLGGVGAALTRSDRNLALEVLQQQVDRDIDAQKVELQKNKALLEETIRKYGDLRNWEIQRHAEATAHVLRVLDLGAANAKSQMDAANIRLTAAQFRSGAPTRLVQRAQEQRVLNELSTPKVVGGGTTRPVWANRAAYEKWAVQRMANSPDDVPRLMKELRNMPDQQFAQLVDTLGNVPPASAAPPNAQQQQLANQLAILYEAKRQAHAAGDLAAEDALNKEIKVLEYKRDTGAEASDKIIETAPQQQSGIGKAWDTILSTVGIRDTDTARAEGFKQRARGNRQGGQ